MKASKWWARARKRITIIAIGVLVVGFGMNLIFAYTPNIVSTFQSAVLSYIGIGIGLFGVGIFVYSLSKALPEELSVTPEAYQKIDMACHGWKLDWILLHRDLSLEARSSGGQYLDVWEWMRAQKHPYSVEEWFKFKPLFDESISKVNNELMQILKLFPNSIEEPFKMEVVNAVKHLEMERNVYLSDRYLDLQIAKLGIKNDKEKMLDSRFDGVITCLANLSRKAGKIYESKSGK